METAYDWITVIIFAGLVTKFLSESVKLEGSDDSIWQYLPPAIGCGLANWLGNEGWDLAAVFVIALTLGYALYVFGPFRRSPPEH